MNLCFLINCTILKSSHNICLYLSATFMIREASLAKQFDLQAAWRKRALACGVIMGVLAMAGLLVVALGYPALFAGFRKLGWPAVVNSGVFGIISLWGIYSNRLLLAPIAVAITSASVIPGWCLAQYPYLLPNTWSINEAAAHPNVLRIVIWVSCFCHKAM